MIFRLLILTVLAVSCELSNNNSSSAFEIELPSKRTDLKITDYSVLHKNSSLQKGKKINSIVLDAESHELNLIYEWIEKQTKWKKTNSSFVKGYVWSIDKWDFNLLEEILVANSKNIQVYIDIKPTDTTLNFINELF